MNEIKVVFSDFFGGFVPEIDGKQFHVIGEKKEDVENVIEQEERLQQAMFRKLGADEDEDGDERNRGLLFFMHGFNGQAQDEARRRFEEFFNVRVF